MNAARGLAAIAAAAAIAIAPAGCGGASDGGATTAGADTPDGGGGGVRIVDPGGGDATVGAGCAPGELVCDDEGRVVRCKDDGTGWIAVFDCAAPTVCEPEAAMCKLPFCEPGEVTCVDGETLGSCNGTGTSFISSAAGAACGDGEGCDPESLSCMPRICEPGATWCDDGGIAHRCASHGTSEAPLQSCSSDQGCAGCASNLVEVACGGVAPGEAPTEQLCGILQACAVNLGCTDFACADLSKPCQEDPLRVSCQALAGCIPLPPMDGSGDDSALADTTILQPVFFVGAAPDGSGPFLHLAPVQNPQTGEVLGGLEPKVDVGGAVLGNLELREDGSVRPLTCGPTLDSPYAYSDVVFAVDVTGSMGWVLDAVTEQAAQLADFLTAAGLDVRFGAVVFRDAVPETPYASWFQPLDPDPAAVGSFLGGVVAEAGEDAPENPLDAIAVAWDHMAWRPGAQRVFVLFTDAPMHVPGDGYGFADQGVLEVLDDLVRQAIVHTISTDYGGDACLLGEFPNPRLLSCATGGSGVQLTTSVLDDLTATAFADALAESTICQFESLDEDAAHDLELAVTVTVGPTTFEGASTLEGVTYEAP